MIHALPGTGANHRMFPAPWTTLPDFRAHDWPPARKVFTIAALAALAVEEFGIADGDVVVGASLGGMVACEISRVRRLRAIVLVGSASGPEEIGVRLRLLPPFLPLVPWKLVHHLPWVFPRALAAMIATSDPIFMRNLCAAIADWPGADSWPAPVLRIHGRRDHIIPPPANADLLLDGGHMIAMTQAAQCVACVREALCKL